MLIKGLIVIAVIIAGILLFAAFRPAQMQISREIIINAPADKLFPYINNSQKAYDWMPWKDSDPEVKIIYSGPAEGVGAKSSWNSPGKMGVGESEVTESVLNDHVTTKLNYTKPMSMSQTATVSLSSAANGQTLVKWSVNGHNAFVFRLMGIFIDCDKMVGDEFNKGLNKLKTLAEAK